MTGIWKQKMIFFDDVDEYCESDRCNQREELEAFNHELFKQIDWSKMP